MTSRAHKQKEPSTTVLRKFFHDTRGGMAVVSSYLDLLAARKSVLQDAKATHIAERCSTQLHDLLQLLDDFEKKFEGSHD